MLYSFLLSNVSHIPQIPSLLSHLIYRKFAGTLSLDQIVSSAILTCREIRGSK